MELYILENSNKETEERNNLSETLESKNCTIPQA